MNARLKIIIFGLIVAVAAGNFIITPKKTEAFLGIGDFGFVFDAVNLAQGLEDFGLQLLEETYQGLRDQASKRIIDSIVKDTAKWIENSSDSTHGGPRFVQDWKKFLKDAGDKAIGDVIRETDLAFICSPFKVQLQLALQPTRSYEKRVECTLSEALYNVENFYNDFSQGGWLAYRETWSPNNNFFGTLIIARDEISKRSSEEGETKKSEAQASGGFLSQKNCLEYGKPNWDRCQAVADAGDSTAYEICMAEEEKIEKTCVKEEIVTPGDIVGKAAAKLITSDSDWANNIQSWTSLLTNALVNKLVKSGVGFLKVQTQRVFNDSTGGTTTGTDITDAAGYSTSTQQFAAQRIENENTSMINELQKFIDLDWDYFISLKQESLVHFKKDYAAASMIEYKKSLDPDTASAPGIACNLPFGFEYRPKSIERAVKQSIIDIQGLKENISFTISQASQLITDIKTTAISSITNQEERATIQQKYSSFISKNNIGSVESYIGSAEREWEDSNLTFATLWKEFDRPECYDSFEESALPDVADRLLNGENIADILLHPNN